MMIDPPLVLPALLLVASASLGCGPRGEARSAGAGSVEAADAGEASASDSAGADQADARVVEAKPADGCAASFVEARKAKACAIGVTPSCRYAEGECGCAPPPQCGGAMRAPPAQGEPGQWWCSSSNPAVLDENGCPYLTPNEGASCASNGKSCTYGACSWAQTFARCQAGAWRLERHFLPPPP